MGKSREEVLQEKLCEITGNGLSRNERILIFSSPETAFRKILEERIEYCDENIKKMLDDRKKFIKAISLFGGGGDDSKPLNNGTRRVSCRHGDD